MIPAFGCDYGEAELEAAKAVLDTGRLTYGLVCAEAEKEFAERFYCLGASPGVFASSGSAATALALEALREDIGNGMDRPTILMPALGFPTTLTAALQAGFHVVALDVEVDTLNLDPGILKAALALFPKARALALVHMLGNPCDIGAIVGDALAGRDVRVFADCCDALGSTWNSRSLVEYADAASFSFYPAHHITCGEGGMVLSRWPRILKAARSLRDWGRDCTCLPNQDNACGNRFGHSLGGVKWDHKYIHVRQGHNMKPLELQGAMLRVQMKRFDELHARRKANIARYEAAFDTGRLSERFARPRVHGLAEASWMGYPLIIRAGMGFEAPALAAMLESRGVGTRRPLGGDLTQQPAFKHDPRVEVPFALAGTLQAMRRVVVVGCGPRLGAAEVERVVRTASEVSEELARDG